MWLTRRGEPANEDVWLVLDFSRKLKAKDPRDKLYSLSNLASLGLEVDYSLLYETLCRDFAVAQMA